MPLYRQLTGPVYFLGLSLVSHFISRRAISQWSCSGVKRPTWISLSVLLVLLDSWMFLFTSAFLTLSVNLEEGLPDCTAAIFACIFFYGSTKLFLYSFLIEKVHVVWSPVNRSRLQSNLYRACFSFFLVYLGVLVLAVIGRIHLIEDDHCIIGLKPFAALGLLVYDCIMNLGLTGLFLWPLLKGNLRNPKIRRMVSRTLIASIASFITSTVNVLVVVIVEGKETGWVCLISCSGDVLVNTIALYYATSVNSNGNKYALMTVEQDTPIESGLKARPWSTSWNSSAKVQWTAGTLSGSCSASTSCRTLSKYPYDELARAGITFACPNQILRYQPQLPVAPQSACASITSLTIDIPPREVTPTFAKLSEDRQRQIEDTNSDK